MLKNLSGFFFSHLDTEVHESPPEVINIEVRVAFNVHSLEDSLEASDAEWRSVQDLCLQVFHQVLNEHLLEVLNSSSVRGIWGSLYKEHVIVFLKFGWHVRSQSSFVFKSKVLALVLG